MNTKYVNLCVAIALAGCLRSAGAEDASAPRPEVQGRAFVEQDAATTADPSATLREVQGKVFVEQNATSELGRDAMSLYPGDRVIAVAGGEAQVVFPDGCTVTLPENSTVLIGCAPQCRAGLAIVRSTVGQQMMGLGSGTIAGIAALAVAAGVGAYQIAREDSDNPPISQ